MIKHSFRRSALALTLVGGLALAGCGSASEPSGGTTTATIRIQYSVGFTGVIPLLMAQDAGFFTKHGLKAEFVATNEAVKPLLSGDADVTSPSPIVAAVAVSQNQPLKLVMTIQDKITQSLVMQTEQAGQFASAAGDWQKVMQLLRGKKIGVTVRGGSPDLNLRFMLTQAGLTPDKDVTIVPLSNGAGELGALKAKQVDGILTFTPVTQQIELDKQGTAVLNLAKQGQAPAELDQPFVMAAMSQTFIKDHPDTVRAFVAAMTDTMAFIKDPSKRDQVVAYIQKEIKDIRADVAQQVAAELAETVDPSIPDGLTDKVNMVLKVNGVLKNPVGASDLIAKL